MITETGYKKMETYAAEHGLSIRRSFSTFGCWAYCYIDIVRDGVVMDSIFDDYATRLRDLRAMIDRYV